MFLFAAILPILLVVVSLWYAMSKVKVRNGKRLQEETDGWNYLIGPGPTEFAEKGEVGKEERVATVAANQGTPITDTAQTQMVQYAHVEAVLLELKQEHVALFADEIVLLNSYEEGHPFRRVITKNMIGATEGLMEYQVDLLDEALKRIKKL